MDLRNFEYLIARLENDAHIDERAYTAKVAVLAALGYAYVLAMLLALIYVIAKFISVRFMGDGLRFIPMYFAGSFVLACGGLMVIVIRSLWVRLPPPEGIELTQRNAPELFRMIEKVRGRLKGPKLHKVLLDEEFNASIVQIPLLGMFGLPRNYLAIGLPLMQSLSVPQFAAVLAHEYGHLSGSHGVFGAWIYRIRRTWEAILVELYTSEHKWQFLFTWFFKWYVPYFNAYTFVFARANEYAADRAAAEVAGAGHAAAALVKVSVKAAFIEERFWPNFYRSVNETPVPRSLPHAQMRMAMVAGRSEEDDRRWLKAALTESTGYSDTHPCLRDRLESLGQTAQLPAEDQRSAAESLLGNGLRNLIVRLDSNWKDANLKDWKQRHEEAQGEQKRLMELDRRAAAGESLAPDYAYERASLTHQFRGVQAAAPLYREILARAPEHADANYALGQVLAEAGDLAALPHLEAAMRADPDWTVHAGHQAYTLLMQHGRKKEAEGYLARARNRTVKQAQEDYDREVMSQDEEFEVHGLGADDLLKTVEVLRGHAEVKQAWLVRRRVRDEEGRPIFVLVIARTLTAGLNPAGAAQLREALWDELPLSGTSFIVLDDEMQDQYWSLAQLIKRRASAQLPVR